MKKIFSKSRREVDLKFHTETSIFLEDGKKYAVKKPLTAEAEEHIKNIFSNYLLLKENFKDIKNVKITDAKLINNYIVFEYADGTNFDQLILEALTKKDKTLFLKLFQSYISFIRQLSPIKETSFNTDTDIKKVFGNVQSDKVECSNIYNIDLIFENIFVDKDNNYSIIDYEWVFKCSFPVNYIVFRAICHIYFKYSELLNGFLSKSELYDFAGISRAESEIYWQMEMNFQKYVFGKDFKYVIGNQYDKKRTKLKNLLLLKSKQSYTLKQILKRPSILFKSKYK